MPRTTAHFYVDLPNVGKFQTTLRELWSTKKKSSGEE
jgi:hypothetical protein